MQSILKLLEYYSDNKKIHLCYNCKIHLRCGPVPPGPLATSPPSCLPFCCRQPSWAPFSSSHPGACDKGVSGNKAVTALIWGKEYPCGISHLYLVISPTFSSLWAKISYVLVPTLAANIYITQRKHSAQGLRYFQWCMKIFSFSLLFKLEEKNNIKIMNT